MEYNTEHLDASNTKRSRLNPQGIHVTQNYLVKFTAADIEADIGNMIVSILGMKVKSTVLHHL
jgi:hypothetical protein